jgi:hypothetical protein
MEGAARSANEMSGDLAGLPMSRSRRMAALGAIRRIPPVAGRSSEGPLTEPTADARACRWELVKVPDRAATGVNRRRIVVPSGRRSADPEPSQSQKRGA